MVKGYHDRIRISTLAGVSTMVTLNELSEVEVVVVVVVDVVVSGLVLGVLSRTLVPDPASGCDGDCCCGCNCGSGCSINVVVTGDGPSTGLVSNLGTGVGDDGKVFPDDDPDDDLNGATMVLFSSVSSASLFFAGDLIPDNTLLLMCSSR